MIVQPRSRHRALAAFLSFLFPGLGQAYAGNRRLAALLALPVALLVVLVLIALAIGGRQTMNTFLSASFLTALIGLDLGLMVWRLFAIAQAGLPLPAVPPTLVAPAPDDGHATRRIGSTLLVLVLLLATVGMHAWAGMVVGELNATLEDVFGGNTGGGGASAPTPHGGVNGGPLNQPEFAWDGTERINFLLLGIDAGGQRTEALTDTILMVSIDPVAKSAVMVSVPRDTGFMPLPDRSMYPEGVYPKKINTLSTEASLDPARWCPDLPADAGEACGLRTLERSVSLYLGVPIQYYATIDLEGFTQLIDAVGPLRLCLDGTLNDPTYLGPGDTWTHRTGVTLEAGCHDDYDGQYALAYARARKGTLTMPDGTVQQLTDFMRAERQQELLLELRREFAKLDLIFELPDTLRAVGTTVVTDFPRDKAGDLASLLPLITGDDIRRVVLGLPRFVDPPLDPLNNYILTPRRDDIRRQMERLFGADQLQGWYVASDALGPDV